jgi:hypothetical protein
MISRLLREKGREQFWPKRQFTSYKEKLEKWTECFPISFNTFKTL